MRVSIGIVGYRGYSGAELVSLLRKHPHADVVLMEHRASTEFPGGTGLPSSHMPRQIPATAEAARAEKVQLVFLATPAEVSMELAPALLAAGIRVVDLSGAFRLRTAENYARWYRQPH